MCYQTPLLMRAADGSQTHVLRLEVLHNNRYTTAANLFINEQWAGGPLHITNSGSSVLPK